MAITQARYISSDEYRMEWIEDGVTYQLKGFDHPDRARILAAIPNPTPHVKPALSTYKRTQEVTAEFWRRVAVHFGVPVEYAKTRVILEGSNATVDALWAKAKTLMNSSTTNITDVKDNGSW